MNEGRAKLSRMALALAVVGAISACVSPPVEEYNFARSAMDAAKESDAARYATSLYHQASEAYREGESCYQSREYDCARKRFLQAKTLAERAEDAARLATFQSGNPMP